MLVHFVALYIKALWYIFGNLGVIWYIFPRFNILYYEKSGNAE
jgi:hypothetical protein